MSRPILPIIMVVAWYAIAAFALSLGFLLSRGCLCSQHDHRSSSPGSPLVDPGHRCEGATHTLGS